MICPASPQLTVTTAITKLWEIYKNKPVTASPGVRHGNDIAKIYINIDMNSGNNVVDLEKTLVAVVALSRFITLINSDVSSERPHGIRLSQCHSLSSPGAPFTNIV